MSFLKSNKDYTASGICWNKKSIVVCLQKCNHKILCLIKKLTGEMAVFSPLYPAYTAFSIAY